MVGRPPLVLEAWFTAQVLQSAPNEAKPVYLGEQKRSLHVKRTGEATTSFCSPRSQPQHKKFVTALSPWARRFCRVVCAVKLWRADIGWRS